MLRQESLRGLKVWFLEGAFVRAGTVVAHEGPHVCVRAGAVLLLRLRKELWASEAEAVRSQAARIAEQMAVFEVARGNALARLAQLAGSGEPAAQIATVTWPDGRVDAISVCTCGGCRPAADCQS